MRFVKGSPVTFNFEFVFRYTVLTKISKVFVVVFYVFSKLAVFFFLIICLHEC